MDGRFRHTLQEMVVDRNDILHILRRLFNFSQIVKHLKDKVLMNFIDRRALDDVDPHLIGDVNDIRVRFNREEVDL
jgi:hypothetical protein